MSALTLSFASYLTLYPLLLLLPLFLLLNSSPSTNGWSKDKESKGEEKKGDTKYEYGGVKKGEYGGVKKDEYSGVKKEKNGGISFLVFFFAFLFFFVWLSWLGMGERGEREGGGWGKGRVRWVEEVYKYQLTFQDLKPNGGFLWYFFTEVFQHFTPFFLFSFQAFPLLFFIPLHLKLS